MIPEFFNTFSKEKAQISNFIKIHPVRAELLHADRQTDGGTDRHYEANSRLPEFANVPKNLPQLILNTCHDPRLIPFSTISLPFSHTLYLPTDSFSYHY
jgi:hypothetical protein